MHLKKPAPQKPKGDEMSVPFLSVPEKKQKLVEQPLSSMTSHASCYFCTSASLA